MRHNCQVQYDWYDSQILNTYGIEKNYLLELIKVENTRFLGNSFFNDEFCICLKTINLRTRKNWKLYITQTEILCVKRCSFWDVYARCYIKEKNITLITQQNSLILVMFHRTWLIKSSISTFITEIMSILNLNWNQTFFSFLFLLLKKLSDLASLSPPTSIKKR